MKETDKIFRKQILLFTFGVVFFLLTFSSGNIIGSFTADWEASQYGYFGMPIFLGLLAFLIIRYHAFNIKLLTAQALVATLVILIGSQFFFIQNRTNQILTAISFVGVSVFGIWLIESVEKDFRQKKELANAYAELKKLDDAKSDFISIASHQLRTPLTVIKGYVSMLLEGNFGKLSIEEENSLKKVFESNERLIRLVENLLNISRIESGRMSYQFERGVRIGEIIESVCEELSQTAGGKRIKLDCTGIEKDLPMLYADSEKLRQVILNLIDNSLKYTKRGSIKISARVSEGALLCAIKDTGIGFTDEDKKRLFKRFSRGQETSLVYTEGTGLGLYVAKMVVKEHKGKIWAESKGPGKGSVFYFSLPI